MSGHDTLHALANLLKILSPGERRSAAILGGWMMVAMVVEMASIGLVVPALAMMMGGEQLDPTMSLATWRERLGNPSSSQMLAIGLIGLLGIFTLKAAVLALSAWQQHRFIATLQADLSQRLYETYLRQPWTFHLQRNSAALLTNLNHIGGVTDTIAWALVLVAELVVLAGIMALLLWIEPLGALAVWAVAAVATVILARVTRHRVIRWGMLQEQQAGVRARHMQHGLHGVKELLLRGGDGFRRQFAEANAGFARMSAKRSFIAQIPRLWYELVAVTALCVLTAVMHFQGKSPRAMLPMLGLFAVAAFRVLPSVNRLATAHHMLKFNQPVADVIRGELMLERDCLPPATESVRCHLDNQLVLDHVSYRYPGGATDALHAVDLRIPAGASVGIVGTSGAGKSTLIDIILGLLSPTAGRVLVDGVDIATNVGGWQRLIGYVPQSIYLTDDTIRHNVAFGLADDQIDEDAVQRAIHAAQLDSFVAALPGGLDTEVGERGVRLSGGQRQRIGIARALYHDPRLLVFDEATSALDDVTEREVMAAVHMLHGAKTLVIVAHRLSTVAPCDMLVRLDGGRLIPERDRVAPASV